MPGICLGAASKLNRRSPAGRRRLWAVKGSYWRLRAVTGGYGRLLAVTGGYGRLRAVEQKKTARNRRRLSYEVAP